MSKKPQASNSCAHGREVLLYLMRLYYELLAEWQMANGSPDLYMND